VLDPLPTEQESYPTRLRSPGKFIRFLVDSGDHNNPGEPYAKVMKMYKQLTTSEDGVVAHNGEAHENLYKRELLASDRLDNPLVVLRLSAHKFCVFRFLRFPYLIAQALRYSREI